MGMLFMVNVPHNCSDEELTWWVESSGIEVKHVRVIRDTVSGASPSFAYVDITEKIPIADAVGKLNGHNIRERTITVSEAGQRQTAGRRIDGDCNFFLYSVSVIYFIDVASTEKPCQAVNAGRRPGAGENQL